MTAHLKKVTVLQWVIRDSDNGTIIDSGTQEFDTGLHAKYADKWFKETFGIKYQYPGARYESNIIVYEEKDLR